MDFANGFFRTVASIVVASGFLTAGSIASPLLAAAPEFPEGSPAEINGKIKVCKGKRICNQYGNLIQLRGISSHGLQWYSQCVNKKSIKAIANDWGGDVFRLAMYVQEGGYETDPSGFRALLKKSVEKVSKRGLYVIIDWHILNPGDPNYNLDLAKDFFKRMAKRYADWPNIIYEVANEPNGVSWDQLRSYHEEIIPVIRKKDPDALILLGTRGWSSLGVSEGSDESEVIGNPVSADNVAYTFHFYAASHKDNYRAALERAAKEIPMFVSEFGLQTYSGDGANDLEESQEYISLMKKKKIGWAYWNLADDWRSGSALEPGTCPGGPYSGTASLKESGEWIRSKMRKADDFSTD